MSHSVMFSGDGEVDACGGASGIGEEEVCVGEASVKGDEDACNGEASVVVSGKSNHTVKRTGKAEYPCVKRLRQRRLLSFLRDQGFHGAFEALIGETPMIFRVRHIRLLVQQGRWADALSYLNTYLPPLSENHKRSRRAQIFHNFLLMHYRFANAVAGKREKDLDKRFAKDRWCATHADLRFHRKGHRALKKQGPQKPDTHAILMTLKSLYMDPRADSPNDAMEMLVNLLDQTLQAGLRRGCNLSYASQPSVKEGVPGSTLGSSTDNAEGDATSSVKFSVSPFFQMLSSVALKVHSQNPGISSLKNAGANKRLMQAGCHTENPRKGSTTVEDDIYPKKKQRTTGAFGELSSVSTFGGSASTHTLVNIMPKLSRVSSL